MRAAYYVPGLVIVASVLAFLKHANAHEVYVHGRCHQSSCAHYLIRDLRIEAVLQNGTLKKFSYTGDSVGCAADVEDYTKDDCFKKRPAFKNFTDGYVYCSTSAPAYIFWSEAKLVITHLNPASGPLGYQVSAFAIYTALCHGSELNEENELRRAQYIKQLGYSELPHRDQEQVVSIDKAVERLVVLTRTAPAQQLQRFEQPEFPLAEGVYAKDRRFCQMPTQAALAASEAAFIKISARAISFYETECTVNRFARRGNQLHLSAACDAEGSKQIQNHMLTLLGPNSFSIQRQIYYFCRR